VSFKVQRKVYLRGDHVGTLFDWFDIDPGRDPKMVMDSFLKLNPAWEIVEFING
jgi:hypothetical protein